MVARENSWPPALNDNPENSFEPDFVFLLKSKSRRVHSPELSQ